MKKSAIVDVFDGVCGLYEALTWSKRIVQLVEEMMERRVVVVWE